MSNLTIWSFFTFFFQLYCLSNVMILHPVWATTCEPNFQVWRHINNKYTKQHNETTNPKSKTTQISYEDFISRKTKGPFGFLFLGLFLKNCFSQSKCYSKCVFQKQLQKHQYPNNISKTTPNTYLICLFQLIYFNYV